MPLDIGPELEAEGAAAWSVAEHVVVGAHRPSGRSPGDEWLDVERHYCFGLSDLCEVEVEGEGRTLVGPDMVRFHAVGDRVRTRLTPDSRSASTWVLLSEHLLEAILSEGPGHGGAPAADRPFAGSFVQPGLPDLARLRAFFRRVEQGACSLWIEEAVVALLPRLSGAGVDADDRAREPSPRQRALALEADELLTRNYARAVSLSDVAAALGVSAPHLARSYRAATGNRLHRRLTALRLAAAIERLSEGAPDLTSLGLEMGFAHHSHFTAVFREALGMPPSLFRARCGAGSKSR